MLITGYGIVPDKLSATQKTLVKIKGSKTTLCYQSVTRKHVDAKTIWKDNTYDIVLLHSRLSVKYLCY